MEAALSCNNKDQEYKVEMSKNNGQPVSVQEEAIIQKTLFTIPPYT